GLRPARLVGRAVALVDHHDGGQGPRWDPHPRLALPRRLRRLHVEERGRRTRRPPVPARPTSSHPHDRAVYAEPRLPRVHRRRRRTDDRRALSESQTLGAAARARGGRCPRRADPRRRVGEPPTRRHRSLARKRSMTPLRRDWLAERDFTLVLGAGFFGFFAHTGLL